MQNASLAWLTVSFLCKVADNLLDAQMAYHLSLLQDNRDDDQRDETALAPIFMGSILRQPNQIPAQYGLLAGLKRIHHPEFANARDNGIGKDPRIFFNITSPIVPEASWR